MWSLCLDLRSLTFRHRLPIHHLDGGQVSRSGSARVAWLQFPFTNMSAVTHVLLWRHNDESSHFPSCQGVDSDAVIQGLLGLHQGAAEGIVSGAIAWSLLSQHPRHDNLMRKVTKVLGGAASKFLGADKYANGTGGMVSRSFYRLPKREACLVAMSLSYELQAEVFDRMPALEDKQAPQARNGHRPKALSRFRSRQTAQLQL